MSPEQVGILVTAFGGFIGTILFILRQISNTRNEARREAIAAKARQDKIENDARAERLAAKIREDEADSRQRKIIDNFVIEFKRELSEAVEKLTQALIKNAYLEGQIDILMKSQDAYGKRIIELETKDKFKDTLIEKVTAQRDHIQKKYEDGRDRLLAMTLEMNKVKTNEVPVAIAAGEETIVKEKQNE